MPKPVRPRDRLVRYRSSIRPPLRSDRPAQAVLVSEEPTVSSVAIRTRRPKFVASILMFVFLALLFVFFESDQFFVSKLEIQGLNYLTPDEITSASRVLGHSIFFVEPLSIERRLEKSPEIKSARVTTGIPSLVLIHVVEREPEIVWLSGGQLYWLDVQGIVLPAREARADLPVLRDQTARPLKIGAHAPANAFAAWSALHAAMPSVPRTMEWSVSNGLSFVDERGWRVILGDASDMGLKVTKLSALIPRLVEQGARIKWIDLGKGEPFYQ